jgi:hypothetical protein
MVMDIDHFTVPADTLPSRSYIYGGAGIAPDTAGFDDVYILSIPAFQWYVP